MKFIGVDIKEFINSVSKNLNKTIIIDPKVDNIINVRSYEYLDEERYYQFFLHVLDVYGYAVIEMPNSILKVVPVKRAKNSILNTLSEQKNKNGDELISRIIPLKYISAKHITPLLRQLNDNTESGSVIYYEPSNTLLITGRATIVNRLISIVNDFDKANDSTFEVHKLVHASANEVMKIVNELLKSIGSDKQEVSKVVKVIADERTNSILVSGDIHLCKKASLMIQNLDKEQVTYKNTKVIYLKYAKAEQILNVLNGISSHIKDGIKNTKNSLFNEKILIKADTHTNSLIITSAPDVMHDLEQVIEKLDIRRAQVLVEAIIVEAHENDGHNLGIRWYNAFGGGVNFIEPTSRINNKSSWKNNDNNIASSFMNMTGLTTGFYRGNWHGLFMALATNSKNDILATPSIVTLDNIEAEFNVGQEVPVLTSTQTTSTDKVYNSISRQSVGIMLKVKPQINKDDSVLLEIRQEVSSVADSSINNNNGLGSVFNKRVVNNAVLVKSGETVVVGGLLDKKISNVIDKVPFLGDIPFIGTLFRSKKDKIEKRNLILFIKPTIIREPKEFNSVTNDNINKYQNKTEYFYESDKNPKRKIKKEINYNIFDNIKNDIVDFYKARENTI